jgi:two-component sensor histidine kinase
VRRLRFLIAYALAWVPLLVVYTVVLHATSGHARGRPSFVSALFSVVPAAVLGLGVWWATGRLRVWGRGWRLAIVHLGLGLAFTVLWSAIITAQIALFAPVHALQRYLQSALPWQMLMGSFVYGVIAGVSAAVRASRAVREREAAAARSEALRARAELAALRARLDPHFLFNTLHSITALVRVDPQAAEDALERVAGLLRYALDTGRGDSDDVTLADEVTFARDYLALESLRLAERLRIDEQIDIEALDAAVPALTLQPLVENAIRHGLAPVARGGTLTLRIQSAERAVGLPRVRIEVADDGAGADAAAAMHAAGLGLASVRQRLEARFGREEVIFDVRSTPGQGFVVGIEVPSLSCVVPARAASVRSGRRAAGLAIRR